MTICGFLVESEQREGKLLPGVSRTRYHMQAKDVWGKVHGLGYIEQDEVSLDWEFHHPTRGVLFGAPFIGETRELLWQWCMGPV